jgi:hypothetical protein
MMILRHVKSFRQGLFKKTRAFDRSLIQSWADGYLILAIAPMIMLTAFNETHVAQMLGYLNITGLEVALLLNFKNAKLEWKRVVNEKREKPGTTPS